jgi:hypothetical protein
MASAFVLLLAVVPTLQAPAATLMSRRRWMTQSTQFRQAKSFLEG